MRMKGPGVWGITGTNSQQPFCTSAVLLSQLDHPQNSFPIPLQSSLARKKRGKALSFCPWWAFDCVIYDYKGGNLWKWAPEENQQRMK